jgi:hypothetical protein
MTPAELVAKVEMWDEPTILAATAWGEARAVPRLPDIQSSIEERIAVLCVVRNRLPQWQRFEATGPTYREVCLAVNQFSCWWGTDANSAALFDLLAGAPSRDLLYVETLYLARGVITNQILDRTRGATMYFAPGSMKPPGSWPLWAKSKAYTAPGPTRIGDQVFMIG